MADVKWIKITTDMFEDEKIDFIQSLPEADSIMIIWIRLLTMAGKCNHDGYIFLTENVPYDENMLAHKFRKPVNIVKLALTTFVRLNMIEDTDKGILLTNWEKHQNIEGLDHIREQNRLRKQKQRQNQKLLIAPIEDKKDMSRDCHVTSHQCHAIDIDIDIDKENNIYVPVINYLNEKAGTKFKATSNKTKESIRARENEKFTLEDFKTVIDKKCKEWIGTDQEKYLRPETLFGTKFEGYLNQKMTEKSKPSQYKIV